MCDTMVKIQKTGLIFGKNSDRSPNEPNLILFYPSRDSKDGKVDCTYISVDQNKPTHAVLLVSPSWMWGAEMGINDRGVIIGNEAVFTRSKGKKTERLTGMDLLRLALENADNAKTAKAMILDYLSRYGQGGNCGFDKPFYYDNSFLIADREEAFILETSGNEWVERPVEGSGNISNRLSISFADSNSNMPKNGFAEHHTEPIFTFFSGSKIRQSCAQDQLLKQEPFTVESMMKILSSHTEQNESKLFRKGSVQSVCMHKSLLGDHTTGSMVVESRNHGDTIWITGSSTPCLSLYKPVYFGIVVPPVFTKPEDSLLYWLEREYLVRAIYAGLVDIEKYRAKRDLLQKKFLEGDRLLFSSNPTEEQKREFSLQCSREEQAFVEQYRDAIEKVRTNQVQMSPFWTKQTQKLGKNVFARQLSERI